MTLSPFEVYIRFRPAPKFSPQIVIEPNNYNISVVNPINQQKLPFAFNGVLYNATQESVYSTVCERSVQHVLNGYNACVFAYGMTSAGKTYSVIGDPSLTYKTRGMVSRALEQIFYCAEARPSACFSVKMSCIEVANERLNDLLQTTKEELLIYETKTAVNIKNMQEVLIHNVAKGLELLFQAEQRRSNGSSSLNATSSRSHVCYIVSVRQSSRLDESAYYTLAKLFLVDLAGSERSATDAASSFINKSLASLELCINSLTKGLYHIPFRQSKLTHILRDCLGGSSRTTLLACVRSDEEFIPDTIQTLRFAQHAVNVKTEASVNLVNRILEQREDYRAVNSYVSTALAEALENYGAAGQLYARVLRYLDAENKRLKQEIMLLSGAAYYYAGEQQYEQLRRALDMWLGDSYNLPDMQSREDFVLALEHCKTRYYAMRSRSAGRQSPENKSPIVLYHAKYATLPPIDTKLAKAAEQGYKSARRNSGKKSARGDQKSPEPVVCGKLKDTGALGVSLAPDTVAPAATLGQSLQSLRGVPASRERTSPVYFNDEHERFQRFKESEEGAPLSSLLYEARTRTRAKKTEARDAAYQIYVLCYQLSQRYQSILELSEKFGAEKAYESQNIVNFKENQYAAIYMQQMQQYAYEVQYLEQKLIEAQQAHAELRNYADELKIIEEQQRKQLMRAFEVFCAGLHRKPEPAHEESEADGNEVYTRVLTRTLGKSRKIAAK